MLILTDMDNHAGGGGRGSVELVLVPWESHIKEDTMQGFSDMGILSDIIIKQMVQTPYVASVIVLCQSSLS